jgi:drug/metabolite transporter (DMT)-like permease
MIKSPFEKSVVAGNINLFSVIEIFEQIPAKGELMSLTCALLWSVSVMFFRKAGERIPAFTLNFFKNSMVLLLFLPTAFFMGQLYLPENLLPRDWYILMISGIIGICLADYLFFKALNLLGAGRNAIVGCSYCLFVILFSFFLLGEIPSWVHFVGAGLVILGIVLASLGSSGVSTSGTDLTLGILLGVLSMAFTAFGVILVKPLMSETGPSMPVVQVAVVRLASGLAGSFFFLCVTGRVRTTIGALRQGFPWQPFLIASFVGGYLAMFIWLGGYKYADASIASVLNQTSTLFTVLLAAVFLKERLTPGKCFGALIAFAGVGIIFLLVP